MPRSGTGTYDRAVVSYVSGTTIDQTVVNQEMDDIASALTGSIAKNGETVPTGNLPMGTYRHTGVGNGSARTDYAAMGQVQDGKVNWVDGGGTANAITATYSPAITALVDGQLCCVRATAANTTTTPTFSPNSLTARTIVKNGGVALAVGDIVGDGHELILRYDLTNTRWELLNPNVILSGYQPLDALLTALAGQTTAANNVQAYSGSDTATLLSTGTSSGNIPLVGTSSATESLAGLIEIATDAEAQAFTANKAIDGAKLATALQGSNQSIAASGYQKIPGGLIIQWGAAADPGDSTDTSVTFPLAFPTACFIAHPQVSTAEVIASQGGTRVKTISATGFTYDTNVGVAAKGASTWFAIGH